MLTIVVITIALLGCEEKVASEPSGQGYVFEVSKDRVLILDNVNKSDFGKGWNDIFADYTGNAIWLNTSSSKYKIGQKVRYWVDGGVNSSFPEQATAKKIEIIKDQAQ